MLGKAPAAPAAAAPADAPAKPQRSKTFREYVEKFKRDHYDNAQRFRLYRNVAMFAGAVFVMHKFGDQMAV